MTAADWVICALVLLNVVTAAMQGFFSEALTMAGLVVGYIVAAWKYRGLAQWLESFLKNPWLAEILGFLIIFFAILVLFGLAARIARWVMKEAGLSAFDRFLGAVLGLLKGGLMVAVILMGMTAFVYSAGTMTSTAAIISIIRLTFSTLSRSVSSAGIGLAPVIAARSTGRDKA